MFDRTRVIAEVLHAGIGILDPYGSCDVDLDPMMTFMYELKPLTVEIHHHMCKYELCTSKLLKVIV